MEQTSYSDPGAPLKDVKLVQTDTGFIWHQMAEMREAGMNMDLEVKCIDPSGMRQFGSVFCHRLVLASCSHFLRGLLRRDNIDQESVLILPDVDPNEVQAFFDILYRNFQPKYEWSDISLSDNLAIAFGFKGPNYKSEYQLEVEDAMPKILPTASAPPAARYNDFYNDGEPRSSSSLFEPAMKLEVKVKEEVDFPYYDDDEDKDEDDEDYDYKPKIKTAGRKRKYNKDTSGGVKKRRGPKKKKDIVPDDDLSLGDETNDSSGAPRAVKCRECNEIFPSRHFRRMHRLRDHDPNAKVPLSCRKCRKELNLRQFQKHLDEEHKSHVCDGCGAELPSWSKLVDHKRDFHKLLPCHHCSHVSVGHLEFLRHKRSMHKVASSCELCGKHFNGLENLKSHKRRVHTAEEDKSYRCQYCGKGYVERQKLLCHISTTHTKDKPFFCRFKCGARFNDDSNVIKHEKTHHGRSFYDGVQRLKSCLGELKVVNH